MAAVMWQHLIPRRLAGKVAAWNRATPSCIREQKLPYVSGGGVRRLQLSTADASVQERAWMRMANTVRTMAGTPSTPEPEETKFSWELQDLLNEDLYKDKASFSLLFHFQLP